VAWTKGATEMGGLLPCRAASGRSVELDRWLDGQSFAWTIPATIPEAKQRLTNSPEALALELNGNGSIGIGQVPADAEWTRSVDRAYYRR
jgi:hypothetical protein